MTSEIRPLYENALGSAARIRQATELVMAALRRWHNSDKAPLKDIEAVEKRLLWLFEEAEGLRACLKAARQTIAACEGEEE